MNAVMKKLILLLGLIAATGCSDEYKRATKADLNMIQAQMAENHTNLLKHVTTIVGNQHVINKLLTNNVAKTDSATP